MAIKNGTSGNNTLTGTAAIDTLDGKAGSDSLLGLAAIDTLIGGTGNDRLDGGTSADRMSGGTGNDTYVVDNSGDLAIELAAEGTDTVLSSATYTLGVNIERLTLTGTALRGNGNTLANIITGNASANTLQGLAGNDTLVGLTGNDRLLGGDGNDRLDSGVGNDRMEGGAGNDTYIANATGDLIVEAAGAGTDTVQSSNTRTLSINVENLTLTGTAAINGTGNTLNNTITGNGGVNTLNGSTGNDKLVGGSGNDRLLGGTGNDSLDGGTGNDRMEGAAGNDTYTVNATGDVIVETGGIDTVVINRTFTLSSVLENLTLSGTAALNGTGNSAANTITGNSGVNTLNGSSGNDKLIGGSGNDRLLGGTGNDNLDGGSGNDRMEGGTGNDTYTVNATGDVIVEAAGAGTDTVIINRTFTLSSVFENLTLSGTAALNGTGNTANNTIIGNSAANTLSGSSGNDALDGGAGNDRLSGGSGNDNLTGGTGTDTAVYGGRLDTFTVSADVGGTRTVTDTVGASGTDTITGVERLRFSDLGLDLTTATPTAFQDLGQLATANGFRLDGIDAGDYAGNAVSVLGDINGDGFDDILIGARSGAGNGLGGVGEAYVVFGKASGFASVDLSGLNGTTGFRLVGAAAGDQTGNAVSAAGDINGDGFADFLVSALEADPGGRTDAGQVYVVFGSDQPFSASINLASLNGTNGFAINGVTGTAGANVGDRAGVSVGSAGDVNGDGLDDIIIGAYRADPGSEGSAGEAYVVFGDAGAFGASLELSALNGTNGFKLTGIAELDLTGISVNGAGDVNGDGFADLIVGAIGGDAGAPNGGDARVVFGTDAGFAASIDLGALNGTNGFRLEGVGQDDFTGFAVSSAGDMNGDGIDDLLIGAHLADPGGNGQAGSAYVVFGSSGLGAGGSFDLASINGLNGFRIDGPGVGDQTGLSLASAGDVNGDGFDDIIVGALTADPLGRANAGAAYVIFGEASIGTGGVISLATLGADEGFRIEGFDAEDRAGSSVDGAGDINGDGFDDVIVGATGGDPAGDLSAGESYVLFGGDFGGLVTDQGTTGNDLLTGDGAPNILVGGQGNDTLDGGADSDVMIGGAGNDVLVFDATDSLRVDGGNGFDTLRVGGTDNLDLTTINANTSHNLFTGIEAIDLTAGVGASTLTLDVRDLLLLSDTSNTLIVDGDASDTVATSDTGWGTGVADATILGYTTYTNGSAVLVVDSDIVQTGVQT